MRKRLILPISMIVVGTIWLLMQQVYAQNETHPIPPPLAPEIPRCEVSEPEFGSFQCPPIRNNVTEGTFNNNITNQGGLY